MVRKMNDIRVSMEPNDWVQLGMWMKSLLTSSSDHTLQLELLVAAKLFQRLVTRLTFPAAGTLRLSPPESLAVYRLAVRNDINQYNRLLYKLILAIEPRITGQNVFINKLSS